MREWYDSNCIEFLNHCAMKKEIEDIRLKKEKRQ